MTPESHPGTGALENAEAAWAIPVMRPRLPALAALKPYFEEIDANRWYGNYGPLERRFEQLLAAALDVEAEELVCVANGTQGLTVALQAVAGSGGGYCLTPSFTFVATAHAAVAAGLKPYFLDVDAASWALDPVAVRDALDSVDGTVAAVMPVAPFGAEIPTAAWDAFADETGIPVVIDAAAGFDGIQVGRAPVVVSLHATKPLAVGEGGLVACRDADIAARVRAGRNFGFRAGRSALHAGTNAKLSEYTAAVGLAALDAWPETRDALAQVAKLYRESFVGFPGAAFAPGFTSERISSTCNVAFEAPVVDDAIQALAAHGIEARRWWNRGCHREPAFADYPAAALPTTEYLGERVVGLPYFGDLPGTEIARICEILRGLTTG